MTGIIGAIPTRIALGILYSFGKLVGYVIVAVIKRWFRAS
jgi:hypothetical protein